MHVAAFHEAMQRCFAYAEEKALQRRKANAIMYSAVGGNTGERAAA
jgi:hypothetical protein